MSIKLDLYQCSVTATHTHYPVAAGPLSRHGRPPYPVAAGPPIPSWPAPYLVMAGLDPAIRSGTSLRQMGDSVAAGDEWVAINERWY